MSRAGRGASERRSSVPRRVPPSPKRPRPAGLVSLPALASIALGVLVFAAYSGALGNAFVDWDDQTYVTDNPLVLGKHYGRLLHTIVSHQFHPLTMLSLAWNVSTPLSPRPFILTNVVLHALNTILVFWLTYLLARRRLLVACFVAVLFGVHPMHVESVAWVSERKDVLYAFLFLAGLIAYVLHREHPSRGRLGLAFGLFVASCLAKGVAVAFPVVMVLVDVWMRRPVFERRALLEKLPFFAVALVIGLVAIDAQAGRDFHGLLPTLSARSTVILSHLPYSSFERLILPLYGYMMYVVRLFVPVGLSPFNPYPTPEAVHGPAFRLAPLFLIATLALALWDARRTRVMTFGIGWYAATIALVLQWIPVGQAITADRYTYLPYVGLAFIVAMGMQALLDSKRAAGVAVWGAGAVFATFLFVQTTRQVQVWKDTETLWTRAIQVNPGSGQAYVFRSTDRLKAQRISDAKSDLEAARGLGNKSPSLYVNLGCVYGYEGRSDSAFAMFNHALRIDPNNDMAYYNRGLAHLREDRSREAVADLDRALALSPGTGTTIRLVRSTARAKLGAYRDAIADMDQVIASGVRDPRLFTNRGYCKLQLGDRAGARDDYRRALALDPSNAIARTQLKVLGDT